MTTKRSEELEKETATKKIYFYKESEEGINQLSKEEFLKKDETIH